MARLSVSALFSKHGLICFVFFKICDVSKTEFNTFSKKNATSKNSGTNVWCGGRSGRDRLRKNGGPTKGMDGQVWIFASDDCGNDRNRLSKNGGPSEAKGRRGRETCWIFLLIQWLIFANIRQIPWMMETAP